MKKYLFGILAVVLAIGFSAFTTAKTKPTSLKQFDPTQFKFIGEYEGVSTNEVADPTKWVAINMSGIVEGCEDESPEQKACFIVVDQDYTHPVLVAAPDTYREFLNRDGDNPQSEQILTIIPELVEVGDVDSYKVDELDPSGTGGTVPSIINGTLPD